MKKSLWVFLVMVIASIVSTYSVVYAKNLVKPKIGQILTFTVTPTVGDSWEMQSVITGKAKIKCTQKPYFIMEKTGTESPNQYSMTIARATRDAIYVYGGLCSEEAVYQLGPVGSSWIYRGGRFERTIEAIETVTVPAGTFEDCLKIRQRDRSCNPPVDDILEWFSLDGLGTVKEIRYDNASCTPTVNQTIELKSYTK